MPTWLAVALSRIRALFLGRRLDDDFDREVSAHLAMLTDENIRRGLVARGGAARRDHASLEGRCRSRNSSTIERGLPVVETTLQDLRYGLRSLRRNPAYALVAVATLAVGIGAGTAVFSVARAVLLRPLPYQDPSRLVRVFETNPLRNWTRNIASPANYADWKSRNTVFTDMAAYEQFNFNGSGASEIFLTGQGEPQGLKSLGVTGNLFSVLGAPPLLGRTFTDDETFEGKARVDRAELRPLAERLRRRPRRHRPRHHIERPHLRCRRRDAARLLLPGARRPDVRAGRLSAVGVRPGAPAALSRRRRATQAGGAAAARAAGDGRDRPQPRKGISRHEHADGRAARGLPRQPGVSHRGRRC